MLTHLHIQDFAIAPELELDFQPGFTVITGETGAGKSILVDALGLLLGGRSDVSWVRDGADRAQLSAEFRVTNNAAACAWLREAELGDGDTVLLRRSIAGNGRSRAWINGTPVTVQQLGDLGDLLVELHGQNEHLRLTQAAQQLRLLDSGTDTGALDRLETAFANWRDLSRELEAMRHAEALPKGEEELLRYQLRELEEVALPPGEIAELEAEHEILSGSGELMETLDLAVQRLEDDESGLVDALHAVGHSLQAFEAFGHGLDEARRMLEDAAINAREAASTLRHALDRVDLSPERLDAVRAQLGRLGDLARKHKLPLEALCERRDQIAERLDRADGFEARRQSLEADVNRALLAYRQAAANVSELRAGRAAALTERVTGLMGELGMQGGVFEIRLRHDPAGTPSVRGDDRVDVVVSANPGSAPGPLGKIASGGELSRISLAVKVATASGERRTQIFDEVDAGIGGDTANTVGRLLRRVAEQGQALCVTHLAQVAVCADLQVRVDKVQRHDQVTVDTRVLDDQERIGEVARMLSGRTSEQSLAHARALLSAGVS